MVGFGMLSRSRVRSKSGGTFHTSNCAAICPRKTDRKSQSLDLLLFCMLRMLRLPLSSLTLHPRSPIAFPNSNLQAIFRFVKVNAQCGVLAMSQSFCSVNRVTVTRVVFRGTRSAELTPTPTHWHFLRDSDRYRRRL